MSNRSRYNEVKQKSLPRKKRTIQLPGSQEYDGKFFQCWYCGFKGNNIDRNLTGEGDGVTYSISVQDNDITMNGTNGYAIGISGKTVLVGGNQNTQSVGAQSVAGCSFCGCKNYR